VLRYVTNAIAAGTSTYLLQAPTTSWSQVQISINNSVYFAQPLVNANEIWEKIKEVLPRGNAPWSTGVIICQDTMPWFLISAS